jgi:ribosomal protein S18 acetylase RimI-like enzyme
MDFLIRAATSSDVPKVATLQQEFIIEHQKLYDDTFYALHPAASKEWSSWALKKIQTNELGLFIAVENDTIIGYISGYIETRAPIYKLLTIGYISNMYVLPNFRGKKISSKLHHALLQWFKEKNVAHIELNVDARATATIATWQHLGYKEVGKRMRMTL